MKSLTLWQIELIPWYLFAGVWAITALRVKRTKARETSVDRLITLVVVVIAFNLLFAQWPRIGPLRLRFLPESPRVAWAGIAVTWLGVAVAVWARYCLGEYWSARVTLKEGHQLIRTGPYARIRHPIYGDVAGARGDGAGDW